MISRTNDTYKKPQAGILSFESGRDISVGYANIFYSAENSRNFSTCDIRHKFALKEIYKKNDGFRRPIIGMFLSIPFSFRNELSTSSYGGYSNFPIKQVETSIEATILLWMRENLEGRLEFATDPERWLFFNKGRRYLKEYFFGPNNDNSNHLDMKLFLDIFLKFNRCCISSSKFNILNSIQIHGRNCNLRKYQYQAQVPTKNKDNTATEYIIDTG